MIRFLKYTVAAYGFYLAVSLLIVLPLLNIMTPRLVAEQLNRTLHTEIILFNPFTLALEIRNARLDEPSGETFAALEKAHINLSTASLWQRGWVLDSFLVNEFYVHVRGLAGGGFNFSDMLPPADESEADSSEEALPALTVGRFEFEARRIAVTQEDREKPYSTHWDGLSLKVNNLSTIRREGQPYRLTAVAEQGGRLTWTGDVSIPDATSSGSLELANIHLRTAWRFLEPWLALELTDGRLTLSGDYAVSWADTPTFSIDNGEALLNTLEIVPQDPSVLPATHLRLPAASVAGISVDSGTSSVDIQAFTIQGLDIAGFSEGDRVSLADLFATSFPQAEGTSDDDEGNSSDWRVALAGFSLQEATVSWRSEYTEPPVMTVSPINVGLSNLRWPLSGEAQSELDILINDVASLQASGPVDLSSGSASIDYALAGLPLGWFSPNLPTVLNADITNGTAAGEGQLRLAEFAPVWTQMDGAITDFSMIIREEQDSLTGWQRLRWKGLSVDLPGQAVFIEQLQLRNYSGRLHIKEDGTINTQRILEEEAAEAKADQQPGEAESAPWTVDIPEIQLVDSQLDFKDESLPLNFQTVIGELNGNINGLATTPDSVVKVDLKGSVDGYAPVLLNGTAQPFGAPPAVDLGLSFEGVDLARLTPYSGTYAGYAIDSGILNLDVHYGLENNQLDGDNQIVIDQLKLGERIESEKAVDLPIQLALALLTDANGVIDLAVPVSGNIDDPEFSVGGVIFGALVNLITKAVTAPFTLLANLVDSDEDLQTVTFPIGSSELDEPGAGKLATLAGALQQRPELTLVITGRLHPTADRTRLQKRQLEAELVAGGISEEAIKGKEDAWAGAIESRYQALGLATSEPPTLADQADAVIASIEISEDLLKSLADERAASTKRFLVNEQGISADRAVIRQADITDESNRLSGVEMSLDG